MTKSDANSEGAELDQFLQNAMSIKKKLNALDTALQQMIMASMSVAAAFESIGHCYVDVTGAATVQRADGAYSAVSREPVDAAGALHNSAKLFALQMRELKDGDSLSEYRISIHRQILERLQPLREVTKKTVDAGKAAQSFLKEYQKKAKIVEKKIQKYAKANKPLTESKLYSKQVAERDSAHARSQAKTTYFANLYDDLLKQMEQTTGETLDNFLDINCSMLQRTLDVVREVAPRATQRYPSISKVLVKSARHSVTMRAADNSPPTKTSRINPVDESVEAQPNGDATPMPCVGQEPFNEATAPANPYLLPSTVDTHSAIDISGSVQPHGSHHETPEQWEVRVPDIYEP
ncbi:hypothetical protein DQ04_06671030 [Trypanosoma grayi]|uniref:hypothetical protein n=1 Tax=Trypanosoma grayi TaxID=71804 RepID=UPI0004F457D2|nr:hypothetical protein DQ04_06671030 [Trypanosoma grayi]KEG08673.1 hypothetical protein DQ04_06671030 [Trypanosoma grayi]